MMNDIIKLSIGQFAVVYLLLTVVLIIMRKTGIKQSKLLIIASFRMTVQLGLTGFILTYIFQNPHPIFTILYIIEMLAFASFTAIRKNRRMNRQFRLSVIASLCISGIAITTFFVGGIVRTDIFNPQYTIPLGGMVIGNSMTGVSLGLKSLFDSLDSQKDRINALLCIGVHPKKALLPIINSSLETALLPTINSMLGMGIVSLPGMMTGQILSGTLPTTAILYQISIMISICTAVCLSVFCSLYLGCRSLYNKRYQMVI